MEMKPKILTLLSDEGEQTQVSILYMYMCVSVSKCIYKSPSMLTFL